MYLQIRQLAQEIRELTLSRPVIFNANSSSTGIQFKFYCNFYSYKRGLCILFFPSLLIGDIKHCS